MDGGVNRRLLCIGAVVAKPESGELRDLCASAADGRDDSAVARRATDWLGEVDHRAPCLAQCERFLVRTF